MLNLYHPIYKAAGTDEGSQVENIFIRKLMNSSKERKE